MAASLNHAFTSSLIDCAVILRNDGDPAGAEALLAAIVADCDPRRDDDTSIAAVVAWMSVADPTDPQLARRVAYLYQHREDRYGSAHPDTVRTASDLARILERRADHAGAAAWYTIAADGYTAGRQHRQAVLHRLYAAWAAHTAGRCITAQHAATRALHTVTSSHDLHEVDRHELGPAAVWAAAAIPVACNRPHPGEAVLVTHQRLLPAPGSELRHVFASTCYTQLLRMATARHHFDVCTRDAPRTPGLYQPGRHGTPDAPDTFLARWHALLTGTPLPATAYGDGWHTPAIRHDVYRRHQLGHQSLRAIARHLGCSPATVARILRHADLPTGRPA